MIHQVHLRPATREDLPALRAIVDRAVGELLSGIHYTSEEVRLSTELNMYELDPRLIDAGAYYVAEIDGVVVGGSGWDADGRFSGEKAAQAVRIGTAVMRASYVDPRWTRRGIAHLLARTTETAATVSGFRRFATLCTPLGAALRRSLGYELVRREQLPLPGGRTFDLALMAKELAPAA